MRTENRLGGNSDYKYIMTLVYIVCTICFLTSIIPVLAEAMAYLAAIVLLIGGLYVGRRIYVAARYMHFLMNASREELIEDEKRNPNCQL